MTNQSMALEKLLIKSFKDKENTDNSPKEFYVPINPETFTKTFKVSEDKQVAGGKQGSAGKFTFSFPTELKLDFILDGTQTMDGYGNITKNERNAGKTVSDTKSMTVHDQLNKFLECVYQMDRDSRRPRFLLIIWGTEINFRCTVSNLDINYTLFKPNGTPLRVKITATFSENKSAKMQEVESKLMSRSQTSSRKADASSRLDLLSNDLYNDPKYILQIGRINGLTSIRNVKVGTDLYFPPFNKNKA
jgi:hypothetical protein